MTMTMMMMVPSRQRNRFPFLMNDDAIAGSTDELDDDTRMRTMMMMTITMMITTTVPA